MTGFFFTTDDIEANFDREDLTRGRDYWRTGAVFDVQFEKDGRGLTAKVRSMRSRPYVVRIVVEPGYTFRSGQVSHPIIDGKCSCSVGVRCKHAVAVCFEALALREKTNKLAASHKQVPPAKDRWTLPGAPKSVDATESWLDELANQVSAPSQPVRAPNKAIIYLIDVPTDRSFIHHQVSLQAMVASIQKDGSYGPQLHNANIQNFNGVAAQHLTSDDRLIFQLMRGADLYGGDLRSPPATDNLFDLALRCMIATGRCFLYSHTGHPLQLGAEKPATLGWRVEADGAQSPAIIADDDAMRLLILPAARPWYIDKTTGEAGPLTFDAPLELVHKYLEGPKLSPKAVGAVAKKLVTRVLSKSIIAPREIKIENRAVVPPVPCLRLTAYLDQPMALLHFDYDGIAVDPLDAPDTLQKQIGDHVIRQPRDRRAETQATEHILANVGLTQVISNSPDVPRGRLAYGFGAGERLLWLEFLHHEAAALRAKGWRIEVDENFAARFTAIEAEDDDKAWQGDVTEQEGGAWWFSLDLGIIVEGHRVALLPLLVQALKRLREPTTAAIEGLAKSGKLFVDLADGRALALPFERVKDILVTLVELYDKPLNADGTMTVSLDLAAALSRIDAATQLRWLGGKRLKDLMARLQAFDGLTEIDPPHGLQATLRPYQREGLNWLQFLRDYGLGGILADDMGLGKTIQALAHIMTEKQAGRLKRPCLIVCPTSLIPNWQDETAKFAPELKVLSLHGKDRAERFGEIGKADIVLTTYPLLSRDSEVLTPLEWHMVVLDEAQAIKNPTSQAMQIACELKTRNRLCMTGTPIENHLGEAWSHFAFLMPGMLGSHKDFNKRFRIPIEKHKDGERQAVLARRLKPFILRRNKSEVAKELPPKTEMIHYVVFDQAQRDLYETLRLTMHDKVQQAVSEKGFNRSHIVILDALLKLRQVCCDPRLVKLPSARKAKHSAKLDGLMEMLPEMIEEGRRVLLFSQFTSMLDLIKPELDKAGIPFVEIRGDTTDRKTPVRQFQNGEVPLFLISLKAGGTGLNLTAADTVIHYDPWWNPAVENQATDRAHRIGQDKPVFVYKFIAKGTVEERILDLQKRKRGLASALMDERPDATAAFEANDLEFLFKETE